MTVYIIRFVSEDRERVDGVVRTSVGRFTISDDYEDAMGEMEFYVTTEDQKVATYLKIFGWKHFECL